MSGERNFRHDQANFPPIFNQRPETELSYLRRFYSSRAFGLPKGGVDHSIGRIVAGFLAFGYAKIFGEPLVDRAIAFEDQMDRAKGEPPGPELVSREVQSGVGLLTGVVVYGTALGGLFSLAFAFAYQRVGPASPRLTAALLAGAGFLSLVLVPQLKYPPNPPSVGRPETIAYRSELFFLMIFISVVALALAILIARSLSARYDGWNAGLMAAAAFIGIMVVAQFVLPDINEVPDQFPAVVLWRFRITSLGIQVILWSAPGLLFGAAAERVLSRQYNSAKHVLGQARHTLR